LSQAIWGSTREERVHVARTARVIQHTRAVGTVSHMFEPTWAPVKKKILFCLVWGWNLVHPQDRVVVVDLKRLPKLTSAS
jgi:hypothetical protein